MKINKTDNKQKGFIKTIILIVIALIVLGYFGFSLRDIIKSPTVHDNLQYFKEIVVDVWNLYLRAPIMYLWNEVVLRFLRSKS